MDWSALADAQPRLAGLGRKRLLDRRLGPTGNAQPNPVTWYR
jgi:hypothetical protein